MAFLSPNYEMDAVCLHCHTGGHNKIYIFWIEVMQFGSNVNYYSMAAWGKATNDHAQAQNLQGRWTSLAAARREIEELTRTRERKGYVNLISPNYHGGLTFDYVLGKATIHNLSRAGSYSTSMGNVEQNVARATARSRKPVAPPPVPIVVNPGQQRSRRLLET